MKNLIVTCASIVIGAFLCGQSAAAVRLQIPPPTRTVESLETSSEFRLAAGDADFFGHGPDIYLTTSIRVSDDGRQILADLYGVAQEVGGTTRATLKVQGQPIYTVEDGNKILSILGPAGSSVLQYRDTDHDPDNVCQGAGEVPQISGTIYMKNSLGIPCAPGLVHLARFVGDTNGSDVNTGIVNAKTTRTSVQVLFSPIKISVSVPYVAQPYNKQDISLDVPFAGWSQENFGNDNGCGASAGSRVLQYYGSRITYDALLDRIRTRFHSTNILGLGVPPGMLRDAMNEVMPGFDVMHWNFASDGENQFSNDYARKTLKSALVSLMYQKKPVVALLGWGSQSVLRSNPVTGISTYHGLLSPELDDAKLGQLHYVAIRGYSPGTDTFDIVDDGQGKTWRSDFLLNMMLFDRGLDFKMTLGVVAPDVLPATIIYRR